MSGAWWVGEADLDKDQASAVQGMDEDASFLIRGPAGSGKTNILLLRGKWFRIKKLSEFKIIVFTASLKRFVQIGCDQYRLPRECVVTSMQFFRELLTEYNVDFKLSG